MTSTFCPHRASSGLGCSLYQYNDVTTSRTIAALCPEAELDLVVTGEGEGFTELLRDAALPVTGTGMVLRQNTIYWWFRW